MGVVRYKHLARVSSLGFIRELILIGNRYSGWPLNSLRKCNFRISSSIMMRLIYISQWMGHSLSLHRALFRFVLAEDAYCSPENQRENFVTLQGPLNYLSMIFP